MQIDVVHGWLPCFYSPLLQRIPTHPPSSSSSSLFRSSGEYRNRHRQDCGAVVVTAQHRSARMETMSSHIHAMDRRQVSSWCVMVQTPTMRVARVWRECGGSGECTLCGSRVALGVAKTNANEKLGVNSRASMDHRLKALQLAAFSLLWKSLTSPFPSMLQSKPVSFEPVYSSLYLEPVFWSPYI